jgi:hypothetical protein
MAGRMLPRATTPSPAGTTAAATAASEKAVRENVLLADLGEHFDRSQRMLVELASTDDSAGPVDMSGEQGRAEQLVAANRLYRQTAASTGDAASSSPPTASIARPRRRPATRRWPRSSTIWSACSSTSRRARNK